MTTEDGRRLVFAGAGGRGMGTPWGALGAVTKRAMDTVGWNVHVEARSFGPNNARYVADGMAELGATASWFARAAFRGEGVFAGEPPRTNLRLIAAINFPSWVGVAWRKDFGISDLAEIRERRLPARIKVGAGSAYTTVLDYYGLSPALVESFGGRVFHPQLGAAELEADHVDWVRKGDFDVIVDSLYAGYSPEARHWWEASVLYDLVFPPLPEDLIARLCEVELCEPGFLPSRLMRGGAAGHARRFARPAGDLHAGRRGR